VPLFHAKKNVVQNYARRKGCDRTVLRHVVFAVQMMMNLSLRRKTKEFLIEVVPGLLRSFQKEWTTAQTGVTVKILEQIAS